MRSDFGKLLKKVRIKNGLTPKELAELTDVHPSYIRGIERGAQFPSERMARKLIEVFDEELVERDGVLYWRDTPFVFSHRTPPGRTFTVLSWH